MGGHEQCQNRLPLSSGNTAPNNSPSGRCSKSTHKHGGFLLLEGTFGGFVHLYWELNTWSLQIQLTCNGDIPGENKANQVTPEAECTEGSWNNCC